MGGFFGAASKNDCVTDVFFGTDYHSHLGTRRGGMTSYSEENGFQRNIHSIENSPFRTKFENDVSVSAVSAIQTPSLSSCAQSWVSMRYVQWALSAMRTLSLMSSSKRDAPTLKQ